MKPKPYVSVTLEGPDDGGDFGRNTPGTRTGGIQEALDYAHAHSRDVWIWGGRGGVHDGVGSSHNIYILEGDAARPLEPGLPPRRGQLPAVLHRGERPRHPFRQPDELPLQVRTRKLRLPRRGGGDPAGDPRPGRLHLRHRLGLRLRLRRLQPPAGDRHPPRLVARPRSSTASCSPRRRTRAAPACTSATATAAATTSATTPSRSSTETSTTRPGTAPACASATRSRTRSGTTGSPSPSTRRGRRTSTRRRAATSRWRTSSPTTLSARLSAPSATC